MKEREVEKSGSNLQMETQDDEKWGKGNKVRKDNGANEGAERNGEKKKNNE